MALSGCPAVAPDAFTGMDLETPGVFEAALRVRAPDRELVFEAGARSLTPFPMRPVAQCALMSIYHHK